MGYNDINFIFYIFEKPNYSKQHPKKKKKRSDLGYLKKLKIYPNPVTTQDL